MRGTRSVGRAVRGGLGIIPAYAGNTGWDSLFCSFIWDHPRVCGEHTSSMGSSALLRGSSPRMRGTHTLDRVDGQTDGIIPAYAGNTTTRNPAEWKPRDHPRVCGEHCHLDDGRPWVRGSSPRMRGTPYWRLRRTGRPGIIPAYAGNTFNLQNGTRYIWDHPRVCGEHEEIGFQIRFLTGSSPRMRGTHNTIRHVDLVNGIIPAYAGNTRVVRSGLRFSRDHPRVCGEHIG